MPKKVHIEMNVGASMALPYKKLKIRKGCLQVIGHNSIKTIPLTSIRFYDVRTEPQMVKVTKIKGGY